MLCSNKIQPEDNRTEAKGGGLLVALGSKITETMTCEVIKRLKGELALLSISKHTCSLEIRHFDCLTEKFEVKEAIKHECPEAMPIFL